MRLSDFEYDLPADFIAQRPAEPRDSSKLMVVYRDGRFSHRWFSDLPDYLDRGDVLVLNDTRVIKARLEARKPTGGAVELLLVTKRSETSYECMVKGKNIRPGLRLHMKGDVIASVVENLEGGLFLVEFSGPDLPGLMEREGVMPTPPYIREVPDDPDRYQTVYAREDGSIAAPTAGLHFTPRLLDTIAGKGVNIAYITLHVGTGTFLPVRSQDITRHRMGSEWVFLAAAQADVINGALAAGGHLFAVGTTVVRGLESLADGRGMVAPGMTKTDLFIYPGYEFRLPYTAMVTNFHLPRSTLIMLVSAFAARDRILAAYETAKGGSYRFYSFGDAMLIFR